MRGRSLQHENGMSPVQDPPNGLIAAAGVLVSTSRRPCQPHKVLLKFTSWLFIGFNMI